MPIPNFEDYLNESDEILEAAKLSKKEHAAVVDDLVGSSNKAEVKKLLAGIKDLKAKASKNGVTLDGLDDLEALYSAALSKM